MPHPCPFRPLPQAQFDCLKAPHEQDNNKAIPLLSTSYRPHGMAAPCHTLPHRGTKGHATLSWMFYPITKIFQFQEHPAPSLPVLCAEIGLRGPARPPPIPCALGLGPGAQALSPPSRTCWDWVQIMVTPTHTSVGKGDVVLRGTVGQLCDIGLADGPYTLLTWPVGPKRLTPTV